MTQRSLVLELLYEKLHYKIKTSNKVIVLFDIKNEESSALFPFGRFISISAISHRTRSAISVLFGDFSKKMGDRKG